MCWKLVCRIKHACTAVILPSHWSHVVQKQAVTAMTETRLPCYRILYRQNDFQAVLLGGEMTQRSINKCRDHVSDTDHVLNVATVMCSSVNISTERDDMWFSTVPEHL